MPEYLVTICAFADAMVAKRATVANANLSMFILPVTCFIFLFINDVRGRGTRLSNVRHRRMLSAALDARVRTSRAHCTRDRGCSAHSAFPALSVFSLVANIICKPRAQCAARAQTCIRRYCGPTGRREAPPDDKAQRSKSTLLS